MARGFRFRLQRILELREHELRDRRIALARALQEEREAEDRLASARAERAARDQALCTVDDRPLSPLDLQARHAATEAYDHRERSLRSAVDTSRERTRAAREAAVEAHRQVRIMESLREKARERWLGEIEAQDRRIQDDIQSRYGEDPLA